MMTKLLSICLFLFFHINAMAQSLTVMTYNIRFDNPSDAPNHWGNRKADLALQIRFYQPDVLGIQEGLHHQVTYLDSVLQDYTYVGVGRDDGKTEGEYTALFFRTDRFSLVESSTFWLSPTPNRPSVGWDAALERICTAALLKSTDGRHLWVLNAHFDHVGEEARRESSLLVLEQLALRNENLGHPALVMGDFNALPQSDPVRMFSKVLVDTYDETELSPFGPLGTFNAFRPEEAPFLRRIDYIFCTPGDFRVEKYAVLTDTKDGRFYSDHFPVLAELGWLN